METQESLHSKINLDNSNKAGGITILDLKTYNRTITIKTAWDRHQKADTEINGIG